MSSLAKKVMPEKEVFKNFKKISEFGRTDTLLDLYNFVESKRTALNLTSAHFSTVRAKSQVHVQQDRLKDKEESGDTRVYAGQSEQHYDSSKTVRFDLKPKNQNSGLLQGGPTSLEMQKY